MVCVSGLLYLFAVRIICYTVLDSGHRLVERGFGGLAGGHCDRTNRRLYGPLRFLTPTTTAVFVGPSLFRFRF